MFGRHGEQLAKARTVLTGFLGQPISRPDLVKQLAEAGLELWQAPEGFWAVRLKQQAAAPVRRAGRTR
jgi:hypothetical protein